MKLCGLFAVLSVVFSIGLSTAYSSSASAWSGTLPLCQDYPEIADWITADPRYHPENTGWIAFKRDWSGAPYQGKPALFVQWNTNGDLLDEKKITINGTAGNAFLHVTAGTGYWIDVNPITGSKVFNETVTYSTSAGANHTDLNCIEQFKNIQFHEDYINSGGDIYTSRNQSPSEPTKHVPNISWEVDDKNVTVYSDAAKNTADLDEYYIYWFISNATTDGVQPTEQFALSGCTAPDYDNIFDVPIHGEYGIQAYYADLNCDILTEDDSGEPLDDNMEVLNIDGSTFSGSTDNHEVIIGVVQDSPITRALKSFKPNDGGLANLITAPIYYAVTLPTNVSNCSPISFSLMGKTVGLPCVANTLKSGALAAVIATVQVIITGLVTWYVAWNTFRRIKQLQDPQDDRVEVLSL